MKRNNRMIPPAMTSNAELAFLYVVNIQEFLNQQKFETLTPMWRL